MTRNPSPHCLACHARQKPIFLSDLIGSGSLTDCPHCGVPWMAVARERRGRVSGNVFQGGRFIGSGGIAIHLSGPGIENKLFDGIEVSGVDIRVQLENVGDDNVFRGIQMQDVGTGFDLSGKGETVVVEHLAYE